MQVSVKTTSSLERRMTVALPAERVDKEVENRLKSLSRTARLPGFRPGKVPMKVIIGKYGPQVRQEVLDEVTQASFQEAVVQEKLKPVGRPQIESRQFEPGKNVEYTAVFKVFPGVRLAPLKNIKIERPVAVVTEQDVDNMLQKMRIQRVQWQPAGRPAQEQDRLIIDFRGTIDGEAFDGNEGNNVPFVMGSKTFMDGFEERLLGAKAGDEITMELTFPDNYHAKKLAGKLARFGVKIQSVSAPHLPEMDAEFVRSFGVNEGDLAALRREVKEGMVLEMEQVISDKTKAQVMEQLYTANPLELPKALLESEISSLINQTRNTLKNQGMNTKELQLDRAMFEDRARRRVTLGLLVSEIIKDNNFKADAAKVRQTIEKMAATYDQPDEVIKWYYGNRDRLSQIESQVLENQVVDWILENATVTEKNTVFEEVMKDRKA